MMAGEAESLQIRMQGDLSRVKDLVEAAARRLGFSKQEMSEILLVGSELATNLIRHAKGGTLYVKTNPGSACLEIEAVDDGPGIIDCSQALVDGFSTTGGLGNGLGTANRLMDDLVITSSRGDGRGTRVLARRYRRKRSPPQQLPLEVGIASRARQGSVVNGDSYVVTALGHQLVVAVIDGLGHGEFAHQAAERIRRYVESHNHRPLDSIFAGAERAARGTRGGVMALAAFDCSEYQVKVNFASIGNIETKSRWSLAGSLPVKRGIIGNHAPPPRVVCKDFAEREALVMFSDGISSRWQESDRGKLLEGGVNEMAQLLLNKYSRGNDDATLALVRWKAHAIHGRKDVEKDGKPR
jgi:anti-sigma regulatory factor (Ser/Thr protein kinase)